MTNFDEYVRELERDSEFKALLDAERQRLYTRQADLSPLVVVFPGGDWLYAGGYRGGYDLPDSDDKAARLQAPRGENAEVTGRGGSDYPTTVLPSRVRTA